MRQIIVAVLLAIVSPLHAAEPSKLSPAIESYRASLDARYAALQKELLSGKLSKAMKAKKSAEIKRLKAILADLSKGKVSAEPFAVVAMNRQPGTGPYQPEPGQVFSLTTEDVGQADGQFCLVYYAGVMEGKSIYRGEAAQAGHTVIRTRTEAVRVPIAIKGKFSPGIYVVTHGPAVERIE
jgi:hypothetical protein